MKNKFGMILFGIMLLQSSIASATYFGQSSVPVSHADTITDPSTVHLPSDILLSSTTLVEGPAHSAPVGTLSTVDADSTEFSYHLVAGSGSGDNSLFFISQGRLFALDLSSMNIGDYHVRIKTEDEQSLGFDKAFTISVNHDLSAISFLGNTTDAVVSGIMRKNGIVVTDDSNLSASDHINISMNVSAAKNDQGESIELLAVAFLDGQGYMLVGDLWMLWDGDVNTLEAKETVVGSASHDIHAADGLLPIGSYEVYAGYRNASGDVIYNSQALKFTVE